MLIRYKSENIISIPWKIVTEGKPEKSGTIVLKPGWNPVLDEVWACASSNSTIINKINDGKIIVKPSRILGLRGEEKKSVEEEIMEELKKGATKDLSDLNATEAIAIVKDTNDLNVLSNWAVDETRVTVGRAITEQMDAIKNQG